MVHCVVCDCAPRWPAALRCAGGANPRTRRAGTSWGVFREALTCYGSTGVCWMRQISSAYCLMVRSEEKMPARATLMMHLRVHASVSW